MDPAMSAAITEVRIPTYQRPELLRRALSSLLAQTTPHWRARVLDDSQDQHCRDVCLSFDDPRITHTFNDPRRFAVGNIDQSFAKSADADFFCVVEDDNYLLPDFIASNTAAIAETGAPIVLRNQFKAPIDAAPEALAADAPTVLADRFEHRVYSPREFRVSVLFSIGVSNGGLFWSKAAHTDFEVRAPSCGPVLQEYLRTLLVRDAVAVQLTPLAVWSADEAGTSRYAGADTGFWRRELAIKKALHHARRMAFHELRREGRSYEVFSSIYRTPMHEREEALARAGLPWRARSQLGITKSAELRARGLAIDLLGQAPEGFEALLQDRLRRRD
jgi:glycosyltransferase involved in cell wall biosynthesis